MDTPGLPVHHQHPELTQTHVHWVGDAIQPSHPLSSPPPSLQSFPASGSFQMSQLFTPGGQSIGVSGSASLWCWRCCCWNKSKEVWKRELPVAGCLWTREEWEKAGDLGRVQGTEELDLYAVCYGEQDRHPVRFLFYSYLYKYKEWERIDSPRCDSKHSLTEVCPSGCPASHG